MNDLSPQELHKLVISAQGGDEEAYAHLFDAFYKRIVQYAFRRVLDADAAEDISANVFMKVVNNLYRFEWRHENSFTGWLFRIASNEVNQYLRQTMKYKVVAPEDFEIALKNRDASDDFHSEVEAELDKNQQFVALHKAIAQLKPKHQEIINMHYFDHLSNKEIALALDMKEGTVRVNIHRAVNELRKVTKKVPGLSDA